MADVKTEKQKVKENTNKLEEGLKELFESEMKIFYKTYEKIRSKMAFDKEVIHIKKEYSRQYTKKILADIPETDELPEKYKRAGFNKAYLYRCYQKEDTRNGFTE